jgi:hypothetical protein
MMCVWYLKMTSSVKAKEKWEVNNHENISVCFGKLSRNMCVCL